jgi:predicted amidohydrolase
VQAIAVPQEVEGDTKGVGVAVLVRIGDLELAVNICGEMRFPIGEALLRRRVEVDLVFLATDDTDHGAKVIVVAAVFATVPVV